MPGRGTPKVTVRMPEPLWIQFGEAAQAVGKDRAALLREFASWFAGEPGAQLPKRPE
jgi:hypothetical protein